MHHPTLEFIRWLRVIGDAVFSVGVLALGWFVIGLKTDWSLKDEIDLSDKHYPKAKEEKEVII